MAYSLTLQTSNGELSSTK